MSVPTNRSYILLEITCLAFALLKGESVSSAQVSASVCGSRLNTDEAE